MRLIREYDTNSEMQQIIKHVYYNLIIIHNISAIIPGKKEVLV